MSPLSKSKSLAFTARLFTFYLQKSGPLEFFPIQAQPGDRVLFLKVAPTHLC